ncbi:hypothetical protein, partial [Bacteroides xylanisolvens]|uniref:hypothetical protein n=1 Tax=Bacteroides xylanisolvens TaxID=371601 RepID=UPI001961DDA9
IIHPSKAFYNLILGKKRFYWNDFFTTFNIIFRQIQYNKKVHLKSSIMEFRGFYTMKSLFSKLH